MMRRPETGASSLRSRLVPVVPPSFRPWGHATPDFARQKGRHVPTTPCGPFGFGLGDMDGGDTILLRLICCFR